MHMNEEAGWRFISSLLLLMQSDYRMPHIVTRECRDLGHIMLLCYIRTVLAGIKEIFPNDAEKWQQYTELKRIVLREVKEKT